MSVLRRASLLLSLPLRAPRLTIAVAAALTVALGVVAARIRVDSSIENLLPAHDPERLYYEDVRKQFGSEEILVIGVFADDVFAPDTLARIDRLCEGLAAIDGVEEVLSLTTARGVEVVDDVLQVGRLMRELPATPEAAAAFRARAMANPLYRGNLVSADGRAAGISIVFEPMSDEEFARRGIEDRVRALVAGFDGPERLAVTGLPTLKVNGARLMEQDTRTFTPLALVLVVVVLTVMFRTVRGVLLPLTSLVLGVVWTDAAMVLTGSAITMGTLVLNPLLMVIGIASAIHLVSQYYWELRPERDVRAVVDATLQHVQVPIAIASLTTMIGFATLIFTPIPAIRDLGVYSVVGIVVILAASVTVVPACLLLLPRPRRLEHRHTRDRRVVRVLQRISTYSISHSRVILLVTGVLLLASGWGILRIRIDTNYLTFFDPRSEIRRDNALISEQLAGTQPVYVVVEGGKPGAVTRVETLAAIRDLQTYIRNQRGVDTTMSLADYVRLVRRALNPQARGELPREQDEVDQLMVLVDPQDLRAVASPDYSRANIIVRTRLAGSREVADFVEGVERYARERFAPDVRVRCTGTVVLLNRSADVLVYGQVAGLWQELTVLLLLLSGMFLSVRVGILALIPNVIPTVALFGIMGWSGIPLNVSTCTIAAIAIGIAIDDTIHLLSAFNAELRRSGDQERAIAHAIQSAGQAAVFIAAALAAGFFIVCLSNFQPVQHFGLLSGVTIGIALVTELFFTPALLATRKIVTLWDVLFLKLGRDPQKEIPLLAGMRPFQAKIVVLMGHLAAAPRGALITRRGERKAELYVLLSGRVEVKRPDDGVPILSLERGAVIGEMGLVRHQPRSADVEAVEDTEYLVLDERFLNRLRRQYPRIAATVFLNLTRILSDRLERTTDQLVQLRGAHHEG